jgi:metal-responsive CopG/Arc/MetJ family transcriptional regulator
MRTAKVAITLDESTLHKLDLLVKDHIFPNRSKAIQEAVSEKIERIERNRLSKECAKLDKSFEKELAEEGMSEELNEWPEY